MNLFRARSKYRELYESVPSIPTSGCLNPVNTVLVLQGEKKTKQNKNKF